MKSSRTLDSCLYFLTPNWKLICWRNFRTGTAFSALSKKAVNISPCLPQWLSVISTACPWSTVLWEIQWEIRKSGRLPTQCGSSSQSKPILYVVRRRILLPCVFTAANMRCQNPCPMWTNILTEKFNMPSALRRKRCRISRRPYRSPLQPCELKSFLIRNPSTQRCSLRWSARLRNVTAIPSIMYDAHSRWALSSENA